MVSLSLQISQKLSLNSRILTSLHVLHCSQTQLSEIVSEAIATNPLLQFSTIHPVQNTTDTYSKGDSEPSNNAPLQSTNQIEPYTHKTEYFDSPTGDDFIDQIDLQEQSLQDYLLWQCEISAHTAARKSAIEILIDAIDPEGYLQETIASLAKQHNLDEKSLLKALTDLQHFEPSGVGARNITECLSLQLQQEFSHEANQSTALEMLTHLNWLSDYPESKSQFAKVLEVETEIIESAHQLIQQLSARPGLQISADRQDHVRPDIIIEKLNNDFTVRIANQPKSLEINQQMIDLASQDSSTETKKWTQHLKTQAADLMNAIQYRYSTMERIGYYLISVQRDYFNHGLSALRPSFLVDAADALDLNISTLSRAANNKYIQTPQGTESLRQLFSSALPAQPQLTNRYAKACLQQLIDAEAMHKPLSDQKIQILMAEQGIQLSRRTVTKYRLALRIPNSRDRKVV